MVNNRPFSSILVNQSIHSASALISNAIISKIKMGSCNVMLTGGKSAEQIYKCWSTSDVLSAYLSRIHFYFGDERCVPPEDLDSNYGMARRAFLKKDIIKKINIYRIEAECEDIEAAGVRYAELLPNSIDVLLLSVGVDGHIASLFPYDPALSEYKRRVVPAVGLKLPFKRLTITPKVISDSAEVFVLAFGKSKGRVLLEALRNPNDIASCPARLVLNATWLLDDEAGKEIV